MRLSSIVEATNLSLPTWNKHLSAIGPRPDWRQRRGTDDEAERADWKYRGKINSMVRSAAKYHAANFSGKRWPELEKVLSSDWGDHSVMLAYLNNITEEWPEGQRLLLSGMNDRYGANEPTVDYLLKKGLQAPSLSDFAKYTLSPKSIRTHLNRRLTELKEELEREMAKPPKLKLAGPVDPTGLDDSDEFHTRHWQLTIKQLQNRIKVVEQALTMSDEQLVDMTLMNRPKTAATREALRLPWVPPNLHAYLAKYPLVSK